MKRAFSMVCFLTTFLTYACCYRLDPECEAMVVNRRHKRHMTPEESSHQCPALLWTYTGTGNTMTRMLLEVASGWYTGSVYTDLSLIDLLPGEAVCDRSVLAVKAHPQWHPFRSITPQGMRPAVANEPPDAKEVCPCDFTQAIALVRDPYTTFVAEYKRLRSHDYAACSHVAQAGRECRGGHVATISKADFDQADFRREVLRMAGEWAMMFEDYAAFEAANPGGLHWAAFEDLTSADEATRTATLAAMLRFLGVYEGATPAGAFEQGCETEVHDGAQQVGEQPSDGAAASPTMQLRMRCAFAAAKHPEIYRAKPADGIDTAFVYSADPDLVCDIWRHVGSHAAARGYKPFGGAECITKQDAI